MTIKRYLLVLLGLMPLLGSVLAADQLTYGSTIKLRHNATGKYLVALGMKYNHPGTSAQWAVACNNPGVGGQDPQDLQWIVEAGVEGDDMAKAVSVGKPVNAGDTVSLRAVRFKYHLHSHGHKSPASSQGEVTGFSPEWGRHGQGDHNDNWQVLDTPVAGGTVHFRHVLTGLYLHSHSSEVYGFSILGNSAHQEVTAYPTKTPNIDWTLEIVNRATSASGGQVVNAWYGVEGGANINITQKLQQNLAQNSGRLVVPGNMNGFFGNDPVPNVVKVLAIHVRYPDGSEYHMRTPEWKDFTFSFGPDEWKLYLPVTAAVASIVQKVLAVTTPPPVNVNLPKEFEEEVGDAISVGVGSKDGELEAWIVTPTGDLCRYDAYTMNPNPWVKMEAKDIAGTILTPLDTVSVSSDGEMYILTGKGSVYRYNWTNKNFEALPLGAGKDNIKLDMISVGSKNEIWGVDTNHNIYRYSGAEWEVVTKDVGTDVAAGVDGTVFAINTNGDVFKYLGNKKWEEIPGIKLDNVAVGSKNHALGSHKGDLWRYVDGKWAEVKDADGKSVGGVDELAINAAGTEFVIDKNQDVWHHGEAGVEITKVPVKPDAASGEKPAVHAKKAARKKGAMTRGQAAKKGLLKRSEAKEEHKAGAKKAAKKAAKAAMVKGEKAPMKKVARRKHVTKVAHKKAAAKKVAEKVAKKAKAPGKKGAKKAHVQKEHQKSGAKQGVVKKGAKAPKKAVVGGVKRKAPQAVPHDETTTSHEVVTPVPRLKGAHKKRSTETATAAAA